MKNTIETVKELDIIEATKQLQKYFIHRLMNKNYVVKNASKFSVEVEIDVWNDKTKKPELYRFSLWIANEVRNFRTYPEGSFMKLPFTDLQKEKLYKVFYNVSCAERVLQIDNEIAKLETDSNTMKAELIMELQETKKAMIK
jgi:hypothetical protein